MPASGTPKQSLLCMTVFYRNSREKLTACHWATLQIRRCGAPTSKKTKLKTKKGIRRNAEAPEQSTRLLPSRKRPHKRKRAHVRRNISACWTVTSHGSFLFFLKIRRPP